MRTIIPSFVSVVALSAGLLAANVALANPEAGKDKPASAHAMKGELVRPTEKDAAWVAKAKAEYPLTSCVVSEDKLEGGDMGPPQDFIYRETGKPDRLVRFCCKDCIKDFKKDPDKFLAALNEAAAKKAKGGS